MRRKSASLYPLSAGLVFQAEPTFCASEPELLSFEAAGRELQRPAVFRHCSYNVVGSALRDISFDFKCDAH